MDQADPAPAAGSATLPEALAAQGIALETAQAELLDRYRAALWRHNAEINLTRHTTFDKFVGRDVLDALELSKLIPQGRRVLDVGSGGGVPGIILAILRPDLRMTLADSVQKKARVLQSIVAELNLPCEVFGVRAEEVLALRTYDTLVVRAVAPLHKLLTWFGPHWDAFDELLVTKGGSWADERGEARHRGLLKKLDLRKAAAYHTPGHDHESVILRIHPKSHDGEAED